LAQLVRERLYLEEAGAREKGGEGIAKQRLKAFSDAVIARINAFLHQAAPGRDSHPSG
jgi:hypothetical protein